MNAPFGETTDPNEEMDSLVKNHLSQMAESLDTQSMQNRILTSLGSNGLFPANARPLENPIPILGKVSPIAIREPQNKGTDFRRVRTRLTWGLLTAAAVMLAFLGGLQVGPTQASAASILRDAQKVHSLPLDRCYLVEVRYGTGWQNDDVPQPPPDRVTKLWTRGDQFWMESINPKLRWAWGRDDQGGIWMAFGAKRGIRIGQDELPKWLELYSDVHSMHLETMLNEVLTNFSIKRESPGPDQDPHTYLIHATPKPGPWPRGLRSITLEVDAETRVLRKVVISRLSNGQPLATTTYTLIESETQSDSKFQLDGHLTEPFEVFTRENRPERRSEILARIYGAQAGKWFQMQQKGNK